MTRLGSPFQGRAPARRQDQDRTKLANMAATAEEVRFEAAYLTRRRGRNKVETDKERSWLDQAVGWDDKRSWNKGKVMTWLGCERRRTWLDWIAPIERLDTGCSDLLSDWILGVAPSERLDTGYWSCFVRPCTSMDWGTGLESSSELLDDEVLNFFFFSWQIRPRVPLGRTLVLYSGVKDIPFFLSRKTFPSSYRVVAHDQVYPRSRLG